MHDLLLYIYIHICCSMYKYVCTNLLQTPIYSDCKSIYTYVYLFQTKTSPESLCLGGNQLVGSNANLQGIMKGHLYTDILTKTLLPFIHEIHLDGHKLVQDNDPMPHT